MNRIFAYIIAIVGTVLIIEGLIGSIFYLPFGIVLIYYANRILYPKKKNKK